jgi:hypothetical protein
MAALTLLTPQQQAEVRQARETYQQLRAQAAADDITPELYLYSVLQDHLLYTDMKPVVEKAVKAAEPVVEKAVEAAKPAAEKAVEAVKTAAAKTNTRKGGKGKRRK